MFRKHSRACTSTNTPTFTLQVASRTAVPGLQIVHKHCTTSHLHALPHGLHLSHKPLSCTSRNVDTPNPTPTHTPIIWRRLTHCGRGLTSMGDSGSPAYLSAGFLSVVCTSAQFTPTPHSIHSPHTIILPPVTTRHLSSGGLLALTLIHTETTDYPPNPMLP